MKIKPKPEVRKHQSELRKRKKKTCLNKDVSQPPRPETSWFLRVVPVSPHLLIFFFV